MLIGLFVVCYRPPYFADARKGGIPCHCQLAYVIGFKYFLIVFCLYAILISFRKVAESKLSFCRNYVGLGRITTVIVLIRWVSQNNAFPRYACITFHYPDFSTPSLPLPLNQHHQGLLSASWQKYGWVAWSKNKDGGRVNRSDLGWKVLGNGKWYMHIVKMHCSMTLGELALSRE